MSASAGYQYIFTAVDSFAVMLHVYVSILQNPGVEIARTQNPYHPT